MNNKKGAALAAFFIALISATSFSQEFTWNKISSFVAKSSEDQVSINAKKASYFNFEYELSRSDFSDSFTMEIPMADGSFRNFFLEENTTMTNGLKEKFSEIRAYNAIATDGSGYLGKVDFSSKGIHAMILHPVENTQYVDPLFQSESSTHVVYRKKDFTTTKQMNCEAEFDLKGEGLGDPKAGENYNSCVLRTYRIAIAATGEYTIFHGGSVAEALAAQVTTMNRVNGIYERDFGVTMTLVPDNDEIIFTDPSSDPYSNGLTFQMINENPPVINGAIGFSNYDIGHVFGTNSGGLAGFGVTCEPGKARGVTGNNSPIGDPFDVDYVAHEIGHQFGASHTFNNFCSGNRSDNTAVEPGSGSTIMAYAGICFPNVQNNSDDHFHGVSMRQIGIRINSDVCPVTSELDNLAPVLDSVKTGFYVPVSTPFALTAYASDPDQEDVLTYNFEQIDNEITEQPPEETAEEGPNFRSFSPTTNPTQYFPRLETLAGSGSSQWEVLPAVERLMSFRCTVKDNASGGGCAQFEDLEVVVVEEAGPFIVTQPSLQGIVWEGFTEEEVIWDVANTDLPPIDAALVDIFLSTDGGLTYPTLLAENVPNNGVASVICPNTPTNEARVMVMNKAGTFFDVSNSNFTITGLANGFLIVADDTTKSACVGENLEFDIFLEGVGVFDETVTLSLSGDLVGVNANLTENTLMVGESTTLTITETENVDPGVLSITISGNAPSFEQTLTIEAGFNSIVSEVPVLTFPVDEAQFVPTTVSLDWEASDSPDAIYTVELSTDPNFNTDVITEVVEMESEIVVSGLLPSETYYWKVKKETTCSSSDFSPVFSFLTHSCFPFSSTDVPVSLSAAAGEFTSNLNIPYSGVIQDINVININGVHANTGQLKMALISPSNTEVVLIDEICDGTDDFSLGFDDESVLETVDCPATSGSIYMPDQPLSAFIGEETLGLWQLVITDETFGGGGELLSWSIEVCIGNAGSFVLTSENDSVAVCQGDFNSFEVTAEEVFAFDGEIELSAADLPAGVIVEFDPDIITIGETSVVSVVANTDVLSEAYPILISGQSMELNFDLGITLNVDEFEPDPVDLISPENGASLSTIGLFEWGSSPSPSTEYTLQIATDEDFTDIVESYSSLTTTSLSVEGLPGASSLFWRVIADNGCLITTSLPRPFSTQNCQVYGPPEDLPLNISAVAGVSVSTVEITQQGSVQNISIPALEGTHFRVSDLIISLISPSATEVVLFSNICEGDDDFDLSFFEGAESEIDCPPNVGGLYSPEESFSAFEGEVAQGVWTLKIEDVENGASGQLNFWELQVCLEDDLSSSDIPKASLFSVYPNPATDVVTISSERNNIDDVLVYDMSGRLLEHIRVEGKKVTSFDFSRYVKGAYLIELRGSFGRFSEKLIHN